MSPPTMASPELHVHSSSFNDLTSYASSVADIPRRAWYRMFATSSGELKPHSDLTTTNGLRKKLSWVDLFFFGLGGIVGAGIFASSGEVANELAGPSVVLSFAIAGVAALLSCMCFAEFSVEMPSMGGAYNYVLATMGEFFAFLVGSGVLLGNIITPAAIARTFTSYMTQLFGNSNSNAGRIYIAQLPDGFNYLDIVAVLFVIIISAIACISSKESSKFNIIVTVCHLAFITFIVSVAFIYGDVRNLFEASSSSAASGFFPFGLEGTFSGASVAFFSYLGFDSVATLAQETTNPGFDMPAGIVSSMLLSIFIFCTMSLSLVYVQAYDLIDVQAAYANALEATGLPYAVQIVVIGASLGIITASLTDVLSVGRYMAAMANANAIPKRFATIDDTHGTPMQAQLAAVPIMAALALFVDSSLLINVTSITALSSYLVVSMALIFHRRHVTGTTNTSTPTILFCLTFTASSIAFVIFYNSSQFMGMAITSLVTVLLVVIFALTGPAEQRVPKVWGVPAMPYFAAANMFICSFLIGTLMLSSEDSNPTFTFLVFLGLTVVSYFGYSLHQSWDSSIL